MNSEKSPLNSKSWMEPNLCSRFCLSWVTKLILKGAKGTLKLTDISDCPKEHSSELTGKSLQKEWDEETTSEKSGYHPSLFRAICRCYGLQLLWIGVLPTLDKCFLSILQSILLGYMIEEFANVNNMFTIRLYISAAGVCLLPVLYVFIRILSLATEDRTTINLTTGTCCLIYKKALKLSPTALENTNVGQMVNLLSNDVNKFQPCIDLFPYLIIGPLQIVITVGVLWMWIGYASIIGVSVLMLYTPLLIVIGKLTFKFRMKTAKGTDERIRLMNEIVSGMRVIKLYGWELLFSKLIDISRKKEVKTVQYNALLRSIQIAVFFIFSKMILLVTFAVFAAVICGDLTPEKVFVCFSLINMLRLNMGIMFPFAISRYAETIASLQRIQKFLLLEEHKPIPNLSALAYRPKVSHRSISMHEVSAYWDKESEPILYNITLSVKYGELLAIVGPVGCGKTSLLMSLLNELPSITGKIKIRGTVAYVSQDPWVFSGSLKQNIVFGTHFDEEKYKTALNVCALEKDIEELPNGDETAVGERGVNLSRGQKCRVSLARAIYLDSDIFLFDDPLSAVDSAVSKHLFERCINGHLNDKTRILVTHQTQFLEYASQILVLNEGRCVVLGTYEQVLESGIDFGAIIGKSKKEDEHNFSYFPNAKNASITPIRDRDVTSNSAASNELNKINSTHTKEKLPRIAEEKKFFGAIRTKTYMGYINSGAGVFLKTILLILFIITQVFYNGSDFWLTSWTKQEQNKHSVKECWAGANKSFLSETSFYNDSYGVFDRDLFRKMVANVSNRCFILTKNYLEDENGAIDRQNTQYNLFVYAGLVLCLLLLSLIRTASFNQVCVRASVTKHKKMFQSILRSPISFFDTTPIGNILSRCSRDFGLIDELIPITAFDAAECFFTLLGLMCVVAIVKPWLLLLSVTICFLLFYIRKIYMPTARDVKRYEAIKRNPVYSHLSTSLHGLTTIRAFKAQQPFERAFNECQDQHTAIKHALLGMIRWFAITLDWLAVIFVAVVIIVTVLLSDDPSFASAAGLAIATAFQLFGRVQWGIRQSIELESQMVSVERVIEYTKLESEASLESTKEKMPPTDWPRNGHIVFKNVSLKYFKDEPPVLKNLNFEIRSKEKIGIVGRTGAGKSSTIAALFRMSEPEGTICIDGVNILDIGLHDLRKKLSIVPQEPILFTGSVRRNVDPFNEYSDAELWEALEEAYMDKYIKELPGGLDAIVSEGGTNFSVGQRQLICLARAIIKRNKIIVLDEATDNVDPVTDRLIQKTIKERFTHCTVLTVAHRLHTVIDSDRILVLDMGEVKEFDEPYTLLQDQNSFFSHLVQMAGPTMAQQLTKVAQNVYLEHKLNKEIQQRLA